MKLFGVFIVLLVAFLFYSELDISLNEEGYIARYLQPYYEQTLEPRVNEQIARISSPGDDLADDSALTAVAEKDVKLRGVVDGDTIDVFINGEVQRIRYIGINTPELEEACYEEATEANRALLSFGDISLERGERDKDDYDRLLRYVYADGVLVQRELIKQGWAEVVKYGSDDRYFDEFRDLEMEAAEQALGCHPTRLFVDGSYER